MIGLFAFLSIAFAADLTVVVKGVQSGEGGVALSVFRTKDGYPGEKTKAAATRYIEKIEGSKGEHFVKTVFKGLPTGPIALAAFHDEDGDKKLTTNFLGIPTESAGASRDAKGSMGPPKFEDAVFELTRDQTIEIHF